ncbi:hypothetical protein PPERSA_12454 [Pseudocohnilembus persalinus]|uniref:RRM domain-containing protein n=1 Tax=Pseudocohnilembus persalinus TaxID=266149 RepID=A0A0V0QPG9_PSEPJ|nr:hypothetical protein PPERSA_12454 [Pseudocohnilembus persalinus]|eukprot:KRX04007.1 hypothetical protein PPERSA_12454 [Pseudocohnilembus persalinus]
MQQINQFNQEGIPKETLYLKNINDKISSEDIKYGLYYLFKQYGEIVEIVSKKNNTMRGQAFVVFDNITSATNAKSLLQGYNFYGKALSIQFAKNSSEKTLQLEEFDKNARKKRRMNKNPQENGEDNQNQNNIHSNQANNNQVFQQQLEQHQQNVQLNAESNILHLEELPEQITKYVLESLFGQYPGYVETRHIPQRQMAFVEYQSNDQAKVALIGLQGFRLTETEFLRINYQKQQ